MSSEVRCVKCSKLLGKVEMDLHPIAANVDGRKITFNIKCPRCGKLNQIKF